LVLAVFETWGSATTVLVRRRILRKYFVRKEVHGTGLGSYPVGGFNISGVEPSNPATKYLYLLT